MSNLLIHSMCEFSEIILDALQIADAKEIVEIGAEYGGMSALLADHAAEAGGRLTSVDPAPKQAFVNWAKDNPHVRHVAKKSLDAFQDFSGVDAWLVDGDHNWFTVYNELKQIEAACQRDNKPMLVFLHDINWPAARRDMYYAPNEIPEEFRQEFDFDGGAIPGFPGLLPNRGFRGMGHFAFARHEGGPRNGVLTAIEDFLEDVHGAGGNLAFCEIPAVFGLGVLFSMDADWSSRLAEMIVPFHENRLLRTLEENRLRNYLTVLDWQDSAIAA
jgi:hypothetical protein